jgi:hypothetical protein
MLHIPMYVLSLLPVKPCWTALADIGSTVFGEKCTNLTGVLGLETQP